MSTINKRTLALAIADAEKITYGQAMRSIEKLFEIIEKEIAVGNMVNITGFGSFSARVRKQREGFNPQTKGKMIMPAVNVAKFKAGSRLKQTLKDNTPKQ